MIYRLLFALTMAFCMPCPLLFSQDFLDNIPLEEIEAFTQRNNSISMFINRFNACGELDEVQRDSMDQNGPELPKEYQMLRLFDHQGLANEDSEEYRKTVLDFASLVCSNDLILKAYGKDFIAKGKFIGTFKGEAISAEILLLKKLREEGLSWEIARIDGVEFLLPDSKDSHKFIPPNSSDLGFQSMVQQMRSGKDALSFMDGEFSLDYTSIFLYAIQEKDLQLEYMEDLVLYFLDIEGWIIEVRDFDRLENNSGWLISKILKIDNRQQFLSALGIK